MNQRWRESRVSVPACVESVAMHGFMMTLIVMKWKVWCSIGPASLSSEVNKRPGESWLPLALPSGPSHSTLSPPFLPRERSSAALTCFSVGLVCFHYFSCITVSPEYFITLNAFFFLSTFVGDLCKLCVFKNTRIMLSMLKCVCTVFISLNTLEHRT